MTVDMDHPALTAYLAATGHAPGLLHAAVAEQPGHGLLRALWASNNRAHLTDTALRTHMDRAHADTRHAAPRIRSIVHALNLHAHAHHRDSASHLIVHLAQHPGDPLAVPLMVSFALTEDSDYIAHGEHLAETHHAHAGPESWPWSAYLAMTRAEQGRLEEAHALAQHALALQPRSATATHALAHIEHDHGTGPAYVAFIDTWLAHDPHMPQRPHLQWHAALQAIAAGDFEDARRRADTELAHTDVGMRSAVNWRLLLAGQTPARLVEAEHARTLLSEPAGWVSIFHTFQLALALATIGDTHSLEAVARAARTHTRPDYTRVLAPVVEALAHMTAGRPGKAVDLLTTLDDRTSQLRGVRAEREIIQDTLARALMESGAPGQAAHLLHHRRSTRHHHTYENLLLRPANPHQPATVPQPARGPARSTADTR